MNYIICLTRKITTNFQAEIIGSAIHLIACLVLKLATLLATSGWDIINIMNFGGTGNGLQSPTTPIRGTEWLWKKIVWVLALRSHVMFLRN